MGLRDIFRRKGQLDTEQNSASFSGFDSTGLVNILAQGPQDEIVKLLGNCDINASDPTPRQWQQLSRILFDNLSIYERAINLHAILVGKVGIPEEAGLNERTAQICKDFISGASIVTEYQPYISDIKGLNNLVRGLVIDVLKDGMAFAQDRFVMSEDRITDEYLGVMTFEPNSFSFGPFGKNDLFLHLIYLDQQCPRLDEEGNVFQNPYLHVLKLESDHRHPWGVPLIRGGKLLADTLVGMLVAIKQQTMRFANPASFNLLLVKNFKEYLNNAEYREHIEKAVKGLRENVEKALAGMLKGKSQELVHGIPADVELVSKMFGEGFTSPIDSDTLWKIAILFSNVLGVPPALLGIKTSGSGIASDEFHFMYRLLVSRIESIREMLRAPLIQIIKNYLFSLGVSSSEIEKVDIEFSNVDMISEKERAEIGKIKAERMNLLQAIFTEIRINDPDEARAFAEQNGLFSME